jgi:hypothetical protein
MRSFLRTNYAVRLNKGIERKLIFRALSSLQDSFELATYKYLGMGSMWFMDFILADRLLRVKKMVSFEFSRADADRARTNIPLSVIDVRAGDAGVHLAKMRIDRERTICWLDFDNPVDDDILDTLRESATKMRSGSVLIATVAATKPPSSKTTTRDQWLRERFGDAVPASLPPKYFDDEDLRRYPTSLAELLHETIRETMRLAPGKRIYRPLFGFVYRDGQRMVTVGGMLVNPKDLLRLDKSAALHLPFVGSRITVLEAPLLTAREKAALDRLLPTPRIAERRARAAGVRLSAPVLASYTEWFREYPVFAEVESH